MKRPCGYILANKRNGTLYVGVKMSEDFLDSLRRALPVAAAAHPRAKAYHMGLYFMASRGALVADRLG